jgi:integrase
VGDVLLVDVTFEKLGGAKLKLIKIDAQLEILSAGYALQRYENRRKPNSIKKDMQAIQHLYRFCIQNNIDLHARIATQTPLSIGEIESLSAFCTINDATGETVGEQHYQQRFRQAWCFIDWLWLFYQNRSKHGVDELKASQLQRGTMESGFNLYLKAPYQTAKADRIGLGPDLQRRFMTIINPLPENDLNPWKVEKIRWRNYALLLTMILGGNRKSESLLLKLNHFSLTGHRKYFEIVKGDDVAYPRSEAPSVKTLGREIDLSDSLAEIFEYYITVWRKKFSSSNKSMYLFLSGRDGMPLALNTPNSMLNELIKKYPEFEGKITPHRLRNTFHDLLNNALDEKFKDDNSISRKLNKAPIQEYAGGWVRNSKMTSHYPKGSIQRKVAEMHLRIQQQALGDQETRKTWCRHIL